MDISIFILTWNGGKYLAEVLDSIYSMKTRRTWEVIAVDSGSTDSTLNILEKFKVNIQTIPHETFNFGLTRNLAGKLCKGEFVAFISQDATPITDEWVDSACMRLENDRNLAGVFGKQVPRNDCHDFIEIVSLNYIFRDQPCIKAKKIEKLEDFFSQYPLFSNTFGITRLELLKKIHFREMATGEDQEWAFRVMKQGYSFYYDPWIGVYHSHSSDVRGTYIKQRRASIAFKTIIPDAAPPPFLKTCLKHIIFLYISLWRQAYPVKIKLKWLFQIPVYSISYNLGTSKGLRN